MDNFEVNETESLKAMNEMLKEMLNNVVAQQNEFFELLSEVSEKEKYLSPVADRIMTLPMSDKIKFLRAVLKSAEVSKAICEKHNIKVEEEDMESDAYDF